MPESRKGLANAHPGPIRAAWQAGKPARNAWMTIPDPYLAEFVAARSELEAVTLDLQHGLFDTRAAVDAMRAIELRGKAPLIRLPGNDAALIGFLLDAGAAGLIAPMIESASQAQQLVDACRYAPKGRRSYGLTRGGIDPKTDAFALAEEVVLFAMIEAAGALEACARIAAVDGLDGLFVGPGDLGISLGIGPGQDREEAEITAALARVSQACKAAGKRCAVHAGSARYAAKMAANGYDLVTVWVDVVAIGASLAEAQRQWTEQASRS
ncbi:MAG: 2,4-dihydroxyhept-2-ene-1,7-dioic acid aldolase [Acetobacteraceae bacterium]|nr:2,4-dihydroxyhept-2-ene-1,7-dioic acid aldolase [Acetobacteraceae bacterium]